MKHYNFGKIRESDSKDELLRKRKKKRLKTLEVYEDEFGMRHPMDQVGKNKKKK